MLIILSWNSYVAVYTVLCCGRIYNTVLWPYIQYCVVAVYTVLCCGRIYSTVLWPFIQYCVVAVYTVLRCGRIYSLCFGAVVMSAQYV